MKSVYIIIILFTVTITAQSIDIKKTLIEGEFNLPNTVPALDYEDNLIYKTNATDYIPIKDEPFVEHVRIPLKINEQQRFQELSMKNYITIIYSQTSIDTIGNIPISQTSMGIL